MLTKSKFFSLPYREKCRVYHELMGHGVIDSLADPLDRRFRGFKWNQKAIAEVLWYELQVKLDA